MKARLYIADARSMKELSDESIDLVITSENIDTFSQTKAIISLCIGLFKSHALPKREKALL